MPGQVASFPAGIENAEGLRAVSSLSINGRVSTPLGSVGLVTDFVTFGPTKVGQWVTPNARVRVMGTPTVGKSSIGISYDVVVPGPPPLVATGPMQVVQGDPRLSGA